jgi:hypothetical protein
MPDKIPQLTGPPMRTNLPLVCFQNRTPVWTLCAKRALVTRVQRNPQTNTSPRSPSRSQSSIVCENMQTPRDTKNTKPNEGGPGRPVCVLPLGRGRMLATRPRSYVGLPHKQAQLCSDLSFGAPSRNQIETKTHVADNMQNLKALGRGVLLA